MKLIDLHIDGYGKFHDLSMSFQPGLNVIYGHNEAGKSTVHSFIRAMLFGMKKKPGLANRSGLYERYEPWEGSDTFGGELRFEYDSKVYRMTRTFSRDKTSLRILDENSNLVNDPQNFLLTVLGGMTEATFTNTVSIGQLQCETGQQMVSELKNYIHSMHTTGTTDMDADSALDMLRSQRQVYEGRLVPEAAKTYSGLIGEIRNTEREIAKPEYENLQVKYQNIQKNTEKMLSERMAHKAELEQQLKKEEQTLATAGFKSSEEITEAKTHAADVYDLFTATVAEKRKLSNVILPVVLIILCLVFLAMDFVSAALIGDDIAASLHMSGIMMNMNGLRDFLARVSLSPAVLVAAFTFLFVLFLIFSVIMIVGNIHAERLEEDTAYELNDILSMQLGSQDVSDKAIDALGKHYDELLSIFDSSCAHRKDLENLSREMDNLSETEKNCVTELMKQQERQHELEGKLTHLANLRNRADQMKRSLTENDNITKEIDALNLAIETIADLKRTITSSFGHYLNAETGDLLSDITDGTYDSLWIDGNLNVFLNTPKKLVRLEEVSSGTIDQIYFALRLAAAKFMQKDSKEEMPLIFDDSFAMYDENRLTSALKYISTAYKGQVLLFTCHTRENRIMNDKGMPHNEIQL